MKLNSIVIVKNAANFFDRNRDPYVKSTPAEEEERHKGSLTQKNRHLLLVEGVVGEPRLLAGLVGRQGVGLAEEAAAGRARTDVSPPAHLWRHLAADW
jgi:hypothetical protein